MAKKNKLDWRIGCVGIIGIVALASVALYLGYNGLILKMAFALIGLIVGLPITSPFTK